MRTIPDPLLRAEEIHNPNTAFVCGGRERTFGEFVDRCRRVQGVLDDLGVARGERVGLLAANSDTYAELYAGVPSSGRVIVPLNSRWAEPELAYALEDAGARVLITDGDPGGLGSSVERVLSLEEYELLLSDSKPMDFADVTEDELAGLFYTGGTTGRSKGVMLSHRNLIANTLHSQITMPLDGEDTYLIVAPMFHAAGSNSVLQCVALGICQIVVPAFEPNLCLDLIEKHRCSATLAVPTMVAALIEAQAQNPRDTSSLRLIAHGASPIATEVLRRAHEEFANAELLHLYGATETAPLVTGLRHEENLIGTSRGKSVGHPSLGVSLRIDADAGEAGEVLVNGPNVMQGYWNKPDQTADALQDGWYRTGDIGYLDDEGYLYLVDRAKDMIISGGENVYCSEVEEVIYQHPNVLEATVFGIPHEQWGEQVHAVVVPRDGNLTDTELIDFCRISLGGYKLPRSVEFRSEELPKSGPGKVLKRELRAPFWEGKDRSIN
ncbi:MAG: AMP-binding protein [Actinomycetota bacterium]|nr:AMP-binding protein [Acidimicrobiales bacterium]MEC7873412.1 AMP-binding protein [Actinomycetota bacterium]MEC8924087.1 AMP-binding protein [Actinomycetota bacterium]MED6304036.1 AMP-binding protein [Actinomycetota bacterium]